MIAALIPSAGFALTAAAVLAAGIAVFDRFAPQAWLRERHDLALAAILTVPLVFLVAVLPRPAPQQQALPVYIETPVAVDIADTPANAQERLPELPDIETAGLMDGLPVSPDLIAGIGLAIWAAVTLVMLLRLAADLVALRRLKARARRTAPPAELAMSFALPVAESDAVSCPMVAGFTAPLILVPRGFVLDASARPVIEHEIAHVRRGDTWAALGVRAVMAVFWWALPLRWVLPVLDRSREALCDRQAARITGQPRALAIALLDSAAAAVKTPSLALAAAPTRSGLARRIGHLTAPGALDRKDSVMRFTLILPVLAAGSLILTPSVGATLDAPAAAPRSLDEALDRDARLFHAARRGRTGEVSALLADGANPDVRFSGDGTALTAAARNGEQEAARILLAAGADPDLGVRGDGNPLIAAAARGDREMVEMLLSYGADVNEAYSGDGNALIAAALRGRVDVVDLLLEAGADPDAYVRGDETPLINAAQGGHVDVAERLAEAGADLSLTVLANIRSDGREEYRSPLSEARRNGHRDMVRWLEANGATHQAPTGR